MLEIFLPGPKQFFFRHFSPFFRHRTPAMHLKKRKNCQKKPLFLPPAENPQHALLPQMTQITAGKLPLHFV
jgi:hypothetical protein